ncbi:MAG: hypothetical protein IJB04_00150 [Oscillospiraceae bacterium]|nr:hypothetical protein [Oscillospiraceae bacterium]
MKRYIYIAPVILSLLFLVGCGQKSDLWIDSNEEDSGGADVFEVFSNLDEFAEKLERTEKEQNQAGKLSPIDDKAALASLTTYYVPEKIPNEYELGKIIAGTGGVLYIYYPAEKMNSEEDMQWAEANQACFEFTFYRWEKKMENPLSGIMAQIGQDESDYIAGKYLYDAPYRTYFWIENGNALSLQFPLGYEGLPVDHPEDYCAVDIVPIT